MEAAESQRTPSDLQTSLMLLSSLESISVVLGRQQGHNIGEVSGFLLPGKTAHKVI